MRELQSRPSRGRRPDAFDRLGNLADSADADGPAIAALGRCCRPTLRVAIAANSRLNRFRLVVRDRFPREPTCGFRLWMARAVRGWQDPSQRGGWRRLARSFRSRKTCYLRQCPRPGHGTEPLEFATRRRQPQNAVAVSTRLTARGGSESVPHAKFALPCRHVQSCVSPVSLRRLRHAFRGPLGVFGRARPSRFEVTIRIGDRPRVRSRDAHAGSLGRMGREEGNPRAGRRRTLGSDSAPAPVPTAPARKGTAPSHASCPTTPS